MNNLQPPSYLSACLSPKQFEAAVHVAKGGRRGIIWWKVGEGKTRIALTWMYYMVPDPRPLIICSPGAFRQWQDEIELLQIDGAFRPRFLSYGMLSRRGRHLLMDFAKFNCLIIDELWMYKNYKSLRSQMIRDIARRVPTIGLSGSIVTAQNIEDMYGQAKAICLDEKISPNITSFRKSYCIEILGRTGFLERFPKRGAVAQIQTKIANNIHVYFPEERREIRTVDVRVDPSPAQLKMKRNLVRTYYYEHKDKYGFKLEIKSAAAMLVKLQQISDGFLRDDQGRHVYFPSNKLFRLQELCAECIDAGERILIWTAFKETVNILSKKLSYPTILLSSEHKFDAKGWANRRANICVATVGSGASLNDFADVRYALFYSTRFSHVQVQQAKGRTNRKSSDSACRYYYHLMTDGFPDRDVFEAVKSAKQTEEMIIATTNKIIANTLDKEN